MIRALAPLAVRLREIRFLWYLAASIGALAVDTGAFLTCLGLGMAAVPASALGYLLGIVAHWLMSSRLVFLGEVAETGLARMRQKTFFVGSALAGLALTTTIVAVGDVLGSDPRLAKLMAILTSFALTYVLRAQVVFKCGLD